MFSSGKSTKFRGMSGSFSANTKPARRATPDHRKTNPWHKEDIIKALMAGFDNDKILRDFPGLSKQSLAALRAHVTRGSYD